MILTYRQLQKDLNSVLSVRRMMIFLEILKITIFLNIFHGYWKSIIFKMDKEY